MKQQISKNIHIQFHSGIYTLSAWQKVPISLSHAWNFFSNPGNLSAITPPEMDFRITSGETKEMYAGQIITYKVKILSFLKSNWVTEITQVNFQSFFIDEQRFGPYKMWHHEHWFLDTGDGILMTDKISYKIPFGIFGRLVHFLFIRKKLYSIFSYRAKKLEMFFNNPEYETPNQTR